MVRNGGDVGHDVGLVGQHGVIAVPDRSYPRGPVVAQVLLLGVGQVVRAGSRSGRHGLVVAGEAELRQSLHLPVGHVDQASDVPVHPLVDLGRGQARLARLPCREGVGLHA